MNFNDTPQLPKWPFLIGDVLLLAVAWLIASYHPHPLSPLPLILIVSCVVIGACLALIPFLTDYARSHDESAQAMRAAFDAQLRKLQTAGESLGHAAAQLKTLEETATKTLQAAEKLPYRMQEKIADFTQQLEQVDDAQKEQLTSELTALRASETERLEKLVEKITKLTADWTALEANTRKQVTAAAKTASRPPVVEATPPPREMPAPAPAPEPVAIPAPQFEASSVISETRFIIPDSLPVTPAAVLADPAPTPETVSTPTEPAAEVPPAAPKKKRAPRKPKEATAPADALPLESAATAISPETDSSPSLNGELIAEPVLEERPAPDDVSQVPPEEKSVQTASSSDGRTKLLVTAYIGIGNKLFVRGEGGGLDWDKGVPLSFVSIGKWSWTAPEGSGPITCKLYKNDQDEARNGTISISPMQQAEVAAVF